MYFSKVYVWATIPIDWCKLQVQAGRRLLLFPTAVDTAKPQTNSKKYICPNCKMYFFQLLIVFVSFHQHCSTHCKDTCQFEKVKKNCKSIIDALPCKVSCGIFHLLWPGLFYFASSCKWKLVFHHEMWLGSVSLSKIWVGSESAGKYLEAKWKTVCLRLQALSGVLLCLFKKIQNFASNF